MFAPRDIQIVTILTPPALGSPALVSWAQRSAALINYTVAPSLLDEETHKNYLRCGKDLNDCFRRYHIESSAPGPQVSHETLLASSTAALTLVRANLAATIHGRGKTNGFDRPGDEAIVREFLARLTLRRTNSDSTPLKALEIACGSTFGSDEGNEKKQLDYGCPWLARRLAISFPGELDLSVSDVGGRLYEEIECRLFGISKVIPRLDLFNPAHEHFQRFDLIFARHVEPFLCSDVARLAESVQQMIAPNGVAILNCDSLLGEGIQCLRVTKDAWTYISI